MTLSSYDIVRYPVVTEKSTVLAESNKYVFEVSSDATKSGVSKAIEEIFSVKVSKVNIINTLGKSKRFKGKMGKRSDVKKAIVTLEKDHTIDFTGGVK